MSARLHIFVPAADVTRPNHVTQERESGPVTDYYFGPGQSKLEFSCLEDFDEQIRALILAKDEHGRAQMRHAARPLMPLPERDAEPAWAAPDISGDLLAIPANRIGGDVIDIPLPELVADDDDLPHRAPLEAPIGSPVCGAHGPTPQDVCQASPHGDGDHATFGADGSVRSQWASEDATT